MDHDSVLQPFTGASDMIHSFTQTHFRINFIFNTIFTLFSVVISVLSCLAKEIDNLLPNVTTDFGT